MLSCWKNMTTIATSQKTNVPKHIRRIIPASWRCLPVARALAVCCAKTICRGINGRTISTVSNAPNVPYSPFSSRLARKCNPHINAPPAMLAIISQPL